MVAQSAGFLESLDQVFLAGFTQITQTPVAQAVVDTGGTLWNESCVEDGPDGGDWGSCGMEKRGVMHWVWAAALAVTAALAAPVGAFYWYGPPPKTIINPPDNGKPGTPPEHKHKHKNPPGGGHHHPPEEPPVVVPTPEPTTILGALLGLGTLAVSRSVRKRK